MSDLEKLTFDEIVDVKEAMEILGDEGTFMNCLKNFNNCFRECFNEMHEKWRK